MTRELNARLGHQARGKVGEYTTRVDLLRMAELAEAVRGEEWDTVEVRRPLEAVFTPSAVCGEPSICGLVSVAL